MPVQHCPHLAHHRQLSFFFELTRPQAQPHNTMRRGSARQNACYFMLSTGGPVLLEANVTLWSPKSKPRHQHVDFNRQRLGCEKESARAENTGHTKTNFKKKVAKIASGASHERHRAKVMVRPLFGAFRKVWKVPTPQRSTKNDVTARRASLLTPSTAVALSFPHENEGFAVHIRSLVLKWRQANMKVPRSGKGPTVT